MCIHLRIVPPRVKRRYSSPTFLFLWVKVVLERSATQHFWGKSKHLVSEKLSRKPQAQPEKQTNTEETKLEYEKCTKNDAKFDSPQTWRIYGIGEENKLYLLCF